MCLESCLCSPIRLEHPNKAKKCYCPWSLLSYAGKRLIYHTILPTDKLYSRISITRTFKGNRKMFAELSGAGRK